VYWVTPLILRKGGSGGLKTIKLITQEGIDVVFCSDLNIHDED
jgi:hypothetical protein